MAADFPSSPTLNQTYTFGGRTWSWNGTGWQLVANSTTTLTLTDGLVVAAASASAPSVRISGDTNTGIYSPGADQLAITTGGSERLRCDSSGRLLVGTSSAITGLTSAAQVQSNSLYGYSSSLFSADASGTNFFFLKSRNATTGSHTVVQADDILGQTQYGGSDGTAFVAGAAISVAVDGTPGTNDMPCRFVVSLTGDGASSPTEQWRVNNAGAVIYNQPNPANFTADGMLTVANLRSKIITSTASQSLPTGTNMDAGFSGLYNNMALEWSVINTGGSNVTINANTGHTVVGFGSVATNSSGRFLSRRTATATWVTYRLA